MLRLRSEVVLAIFGMIVAAGCSQPAGPATPVDFSNTSNVTDLANSMLDSSARFDLGNRSDMPLFSVDSGGQHDFGPGPDMHAQIIVDMQAPIVDLAGNTSDMRGIVNDLAVAAPPDMTGLNGCDQYSLCVGNCFDTTETQTDYDNCVVDTCIPNSTSQAQTLLNAALQCGVDQCVTDGRCTDENDLSNDCLICQFNATAYLLNFSCSPHNDPDCNTSGCSNQVNACIADTP